MNNCVGLSKSVCRKQLYDGRPVSDGKLLAYYVLHNLWFQYYILNTCCACMARLSLSIVCILTCVRSDVDRLLQFFRMNRPNVIEIEYEKYVCSRFIQRIYFQLWCDQRFPIEWDHFLHLPISSCFFHISQCFAGKKKCKRTIHLREICGKFSDDTRLVAHDIIDVVVSIYSL